MTLSTDLGLLSDVDAPKHPAYAAFAEEMKDREYGGETLDAAWAWFKSGWERAENSVQVRFRAKLTDAVERAWVQKLEAAWSMQPLEERKRRLHAVIRLSVELEKIRERESFATKMAEMPIESVIEGDWPMVEEWAQHFSFADERDEIRDRAAPVYAVFRELLLQALRGGKAQ